MKRAGTMVGKRVRLHGPRYAPAHIIAVVKGHDGEDVWVCKTWGKYRRYWEYSAVVAEYYADCVVKR